MGPCDSVEVAVAAENYSAAKMLKMLIFREGKRTSLKCLVLLFIFVIIALHED